MDLKSIGGAALEVGEDALIVGAVGLLLPEAVGAGAAVAGGRALWAGGRAMARFAPKAMRYASSFFGRGAAAEAGAVVKAAGGLAAPAAGAAAGVGAAGAGAGVAEAGVAAAARAAAPAAAGAAEAAAPAASGGLARALGGIGAAAAPAALAAAAPSVAGRLARGAWGATRRGAGAAGHALGRFAAETALPEAGRLAMGAALPSRRRDGALGMLEGLLGKGAKLAAILFLLKEARDWLFAKRPEAAASAPALHGRAADVAARMTPEAAGRAVASLDGRTADAAQGRTPVSATPGASSVAASRASHEAVATVTTRVNGNDRSVVLPRMSGDDDAARLAHVRSFWAEQSARGFVPPMAEGATVAFGVEASGARSTYRMDRDGSFERVPTSSSLGGAAPPMRGKELAAGDLGSVASDPAALRGVARSAGLPMEGLRAFAQFDPGSGATALTLAGTGAPGAEPSSTLTLTRDPRGNGLAVATAAAASGRGSVSKEAVLPDASSIFDPARAGRFALVPGAAEAAGALASLARPDDPLSRAALDHARSARVVAIAGREPSLGAVFDGGEGPSASRTSVTATRGAMTLNILDPRSDSSTPLWSKTLSDPSIKVGRDGGLDMGQSSAALLGAFVGDPRGVARGLSGVRDQGSLLGDIRAIKGADAAVETGRALDGLALPKPRGRSEGVGR